MKEVWSVATRSMAYRQVNEKTKEPIAAANSEAYEKFEKALAKIV